jgi:hypothetical protein
VLRRIFLVAGFVAVALFGALIGGDGWAWTIFFGLIALLAAVFPDIFLGPSLPRSPR